MFQVLIPFWNLFSDCNSYVTLIWNRINSLLCSGHSIGSKAVKDYISISMLTAHHWLILNVESTITLQSFCYTSYSQAPHPWHWQLLFCFDSKVGLYISLYLAAVHLTTWRRSESVVGCGWLGARGYVHLSMLSWIGPHPAALCPEMSEYFQRWQP